MLELTPRINKGFFKEINKCFRSRTLQKQNLFTDEVYCGETLQMGLK